MLLNINDDRHVRNPDVSEIKSAVAGLPPEQFLILIRAEEEYIQVFHHEDNIYQLEYRDGSAEKHFGVDPDKIDVRDVETAFVKYFENAADWSAAWTWERVEFDGDTDLDEE